MRKGPLLIGLVFIGLASLWFVRSKTHSDNTTAKILRVGVTAGPHAMIMEQVKKEAKKQGLEIRVVEFNDFLLPNEALQHGEIDVNSYQHQPFLEEQLKSRGYSLIAISKTVLMPMGLYSQKLKRAQDIPDHAVISIPNDPTNEGRALILLEKMGLIKLKNQVNPTLLDITDNPKKLQIKELEAPTLVMTLPDVTAAVINTDWVVLAGMDPKKVLQSESTDSPYTNIMVIKKGFENRDDIKKLTGLYQSQVIKDYILKTFEGAVVPAW